jgi:hypothetical protein
MSNCSSLGLNEETLQAKVTPTFEKTDRLARIKATAATRSRLRLGRAARVVGTARPDIFGDQNPAAIG